MSAASTNVLRWTAHLLPARTQLPSAHVFGCAVLGAASCYAYWHQVALLRRIVHVYSTLKHQLQPVPFVLEALTLGDVTGHDGVVQETVDESVEEGATDSRDSSAKPAPMCAVCVLPQVQFVELEYAPGSEELIYNEEQVLIDALKSWRWAPGQTITRDQVCGEANDAHDRDVLQRLYKLVHDQYVQHQGGNPVTNFPTTIRIQLNQTVLNMLQQTCALADDDGGVLLVSDGPDVTGQMD